MRSIVVTTPGLGVQVGGVTAVAGSVQMQVGGSSAQQQAAVGSASNPGSSVPVLTPQLSRDEDFLRSMGIQVQGTGVGTPADFNQPGRISVYGDKTSEKASGEAAPSAEKATLSDGDKGAGRLNTAGVKPSDAKGDAAPGVEKPGSSEPSGNRDGAIGTSTPPTEEPAPGSRPPLPADPTSGHPPARSPVEKPGVEKPGLEKTGPSPKPERAAPPLARSRQPLPALRHGHRDFDADVATPTVSEPVVERVSHGFEKDLGSARPTDTRIQGTGIAVPKCMEESREGVDC